MIFSIEFIYLIYLKDKEEKVMDGRISFALNIYNDVCCIHKPSGSPISPELFPTSF